ncbi:Glutamate--tRNA ligase [Dissostichus eleginoides]|uniref:Glutamate--tRNA ligase n=1 Tax=Dissostichus eleginoides TaxID=100907 RepID=A0AAD9C7T9_DISEL|nr:Glutamate--tRNA ligase [Dissostichus eleginoides]
MVRCFWLRGSCRRKEAAPSVSQCLVITKNNRAHRGTGLDQPHIPTTPPLLKETNENTGCRGAPAEAQGGVQSGFAPLLCALLRCSRAHGMKNVVM